MKTKLDKLIELMYPGVNEVRKTYPLKSDVDQLKREVCRINNLPYYRIDHRSNKGNNVRSRQMVMVSLRIFTNLGLSEIGFATGRKDHATVIWSIKQAARHFETESKYRDDFNLVITAAENIFNRKRGIKKHYGIISKSLWKYAVNSLKDQLSEYNTPPALRVEISKLEDIIKDKDREIRMLKGQVERSRIKNSYEYVD